MSQKLDPQEKLALIGDQMTLEPDEEVSRAAPPAPRVAPCGYSPGQVHAAASQAMERLTRGNGDPARELGPKKNSLGLYDAALPGGKRTTLLKTLLTSACERDCYYCPFRARRNYRRVTFKPDEMARVFQEMWESGVAQGLFLSSGVAGGGMRTQDRLIATADILRRQYRYPGYLHLKLMPGAEREQIRRAMLLADRVSINLEAPNAKRLEALAPHKGFADELLRTLQWAEEIRQTEPASVGWKGRWPSLATQFVVGASEESDLEILATTEYLLRQLRLARIYYSAFSPVPDTPLEDHAPASATREERLYQASFLLRDYQFEMEELPLDAQGNLPLDADPKLAWARARLAGQPVEVNRADRRELLRIPGIGPRGAEAIVAARRAGRLRDARDLEKLGIAARRAAPFVLLDGRRPAHQLALW